MAITTKINRSKGIKDIAKGRSKGTQRLQPLKHSLVANIQGHWNRLRI